MDKWLLRIALILFLEGCAPDTSLTVTSWGVFYGHLDKEQTSSLTVWGLFVGPIGVGYLEAVRNMPPRSDLPDITLPGRK